MSTRQELAAQIGPMWDRALAEDGAERDMSSAVTIEAGTSGTALLNAREPGVFAGEALFEMLRTRYPGTLDIQPHVTDGERFDAGTPLAAVQGPLTLIVSIERTLLNFLERLCGVATLTRQFVDAVEGTSAAILDTRKTIPGWRLLDKYAVRCGGGQNHRMGLHDAVLVKDNHLARIPLNQLPEAVQEIMNRIKVLDPAPDFVEFEVDTLDQYDLLLKVPGIDVILLDNFTGDQLAEAVNRRQRAGLQGRPALEASGNVRLDNVAQVARTGVDRIAIGALTHSARALDIGLDFQNNI